MTIPSLTAKKVFTISGNLLDEIKSELRTGDMLAVSRTVSEILGAIVTIISKSENGPKGREQTLLALAALTSLWLNKNEAVLDELAVELDKALFSPKESKH